MQSMLYICHSLIILHSIVIIAHIPYIYILSCVYVVTGVGCSYRVASYVDCMGVESVPVMRLSHDEYCIMGDDGIYTWYIEK